MSVTLRCSEINILCCALNESTLLLIDMVSSIILVQTLKYLRCRTKKKQQRYFPLVQYSHNTRYFIINLHIYKDIGSFTPSYCTGTRRLCCSLILHQQSWQLPQTEGLKGIDYNIFDVSHHLLTATNSHLTDNTFSTELLIAMLKQQQIIMHKHCWSNNK